MAKVIAKKFDSHKTRTPGFSFKKDDESGNYRKVTFEYEFNEVTNKSKKISENISSNLYKLSDCTDYDHHMILSGPGGTEHKLYFKEINDNPN